MHINTINKLLNRGNKTNKMNTNYRTNSEQRTPREMVEPRNISGKHINQSRIYNIDIPEIDVTATIFGDFDAIRQSTPKELRLK